jgi:hypothetical protein
MHVMVNLYCVDAVYISCIFQEVVLLMAESTNLKYDLCHSWTTSTVTIPANFKQTPQILAHSHWRSQKLHVSLVDYLRYPAIIWISGGPKWQVSNVNL